MTLNFLIVFFRWPLLFLESEVYIFLMYYILFSDIFNFPDLLINSGWDQCQVLW